MITPEQIYLISAAVLFLLACCYLALTLHARHDQESSYTPPRQLPPNLPTSAAGRRNLRLAQNGGQHTDQEWQQLCQAFGMRCARCGNLAPLTKDHIIPVTQGGPDSIDNIQPLCRSCNSKKGARTTSYRSNA